MEHLRWTVRRGDTNLATELWPALHNLPTQGQISGPKRDPSIAQTPMRHFLKYWTFGVCLNVIDGRIFTFEALGDARGLGITALEGRRLWNTALAQFQVMWGFSRSSVDRPTHKGGYRPLAGLSPVEFDSAAFFEVRVYDHVDHVWKFHELLGIPTHWPL